MFWKKKPKNGGNGPKNPKKPDPEAVPGTRLTREQIIAQARANAAAARAEIGDETLGKIRDALMKKQQSAIEQAKAKIKAADAAEVRGHVRALMRDDD